MRQLQPQCPRCGRGPGNGPDLTSPVIIEAARRWANLTSPETIEKAAEALSRRLRYEYPQLNFPPGVNPSYREIVRAVLRSVEEGET